MIKLSYEGKEYALEFTRRTIKLMEAQGFVLGDLQTKPATCVPMLFEGAFQAHHKNIKKDIPETIYKNLKNKDGIIEALIEMYSDTLLSIIGDDENEGEIEWTVV